MIESNKRITYIKRHCEEKMTNCGVFINNSQRNVCEACFWMRSEKENLSHFLRVIIRWSLETHRTSKIAFEEDESQSRI